MAREQMLQRWKTMIGRTWEKLRRQYCLPIPIPLPDRKEVDSNFRDEIAEAREDELPDLLEEHRQLANLKVQSLASITPLDKYIPAW